MSRPDDEGFSIMDVSTAILDDDKFQRLAVHAPDRFDAAVTGFLATLGRSWSKGRRVTIDKAWPAYRKLDTLAVEALQHVGLIDARGLIPAATWRAWFNEAYERREKSRARWGRGNEKRRKGRKPNGDDSAVTALSPQGDGAVTTPPVRPSAPPVPPEPSAPRTNDALAQEKKKKPGETLAEWAARVGEPVGAAS